MEENKVEATEKPRRQSQTKLTAADKEALLAILKRPDVRVDGKISIPLVVTLSGMKYHVVYNFIRNDRYWHAQVGEAALDKLAPGESDQIDAGDEPPTGVLISNQQFDQYKAMIRQQHKMIAGDWEKLGMTEEAGKRMEHYIGLGAAPTGMILRATTGQLISNLELLDRIIKADCERVLTGRLPKEEGKDGEERDPDQVEREWRHTVFSGMKLQLDMFAHVHKVQALMSRVMRDLHLMNGGQAPAAAKGTFDMPASGVSERPN